MQRLLSRPLLSPSVLPPLARGVKYQPFDSGHDEADLAEARTWHRSFTDDSLPKGKTTFSRSSGPGGQHVNKFVSGPNQHETLNGDSTRWITPARSLPVLTS